MKPLTEVMLALPQRRTKHFVRLIALGKAVIWEVLVEYVHDFVCQPW